MALVAAHVKRQMLHFFSLPVGFFTYSAPVKSTPVTLKGGASSTLNFGRGGGSGVRYGLPITLVHFTHVRNNDLTHCRMDGIQYFCLSCVMVEFTPECSWFS